MEALNERRIRQVAQQVAKHAETRPDARPVIFFNASTRLSGLSLNAAYSLITSWAVRLSGNPVIHFVCNSGMSRCVLGTNRDDVDALPPCRECVNTSHVLFTGAERRDFQYSQDETLEKQIAGLELAALEEVEYGGLPLGRLVLPSLRWILRRHHLADDLPTRSLYRFYILSAWNVALEFSRLLDDENPLSVVLFNGMFYPEAIAKVLAGRRGIRVINHEVALRPFTAFFTTGEATAYPIDIPAEFELTPAQEARLDEYLAQRFQGNFTMAGVQFWPEMRGLPQEFWQRTASFRQIVPVFTNVIFDTSQGHANVVFSHMFAWLDQVLEIIRSHPETLFVLRSHPDETRPGKESRESVADWAAHNQVEALPNVIFVPSDEYLSSYELIRRSKFVMVYNSTIGLEASLLGAAVLCAGKARFTQLPTVFFPPTPQAFRQMTEEFLTTEKVEVPEEFRRNSRRFLYYQLFRAVTSFGDFIEDGGVWQGYARLKNFSWQDLEPKNSPSLRVVVDGILENKPFLASE